MAAPATGAARRSRKARARAARVLIDTHVFLWWLADDPALSTRARTCLSDPGTEVLFSAASGWELAIKASAGRLEVRGPLERFVTEELAANRMEMLPVALGHAMRVASLPWHHRDPFDRLLVAQALVERIPLVTADRALRRYGVEILW